MATHQTVRLGVGRHDGPGRVVCVMELASMLAGERFSDRPTSVCPVIGAILRAYNDNLSDGLRDDLYRYAAEAVGTRGGYALQHRRAELALEWASARHEARSKPWRKPRSRPDADWSPDLISEYVVTSLGRRISAEDHPQVLKLIDRLISVGELVEHLPQPVEDRGCCQEVPVAETVECSAPARLDLFPAPLDYLGSAAGQRREHETLVLT
jgi:hypothetical protein